MPQRWLCSSAAAWTETAASSLQIEWAASSRRRQRLSTQGIVLRKPSSSDHTAAATRPQLLFPLACALLLQRKGQAVAAASAEYRAAACLALETPRQINCGESVPIYTLADHLLPLSRVSPVYVQSKYARSSRRDKSQKSQRSSAQESNAC